VPAATQQAVTKRTLIGWDGIRFTLPPEWNLTGIPADRYSGYLKVDSPGSMFVQVKWTDPNFVRVRNLADVVLRAWKRYRKPRVAPSAPDIRAALDAFLKETSRQARKARAPFESKVRPETKEMGGARTSISFSWTGAGQGQGKIWHCATCGRVVIAQVVGQPRDNVAQVASELFGSFEDHAVEGWNTWAFYDLVSAVPQGYWLRDRKLMSGQLSLEFCGKGGQSIRIERWGLANVTQRKFTVVEWLTHVCGAGNERAEVVEARVRGHEGARAEGRIRGLFAQARALRDAVTTFRPANRYAAVCWVCPESNKTFALQVRHSVGSEGLLDELIDRCQCH
jgi:hypothetical protein